MASGKYRSCLARFTELPPGQTPSSQALRPGELRFDNQERGTAAPSPASHAGASESSTVRATKPSPANPIET